MIDNFDYFIPSARMIENIAIRDDIYYRCPYCCGKKIYKNIKLKMLKFHITRTHNYKMNEIKDKYFGRLY